MTVLDIRKTVVFAGVPAVSRAVALALILALSFAIYSGSLATSPHWDEVILLKEREFFPVQWDWFWHLVSYSRSRILAPGDSLLFRPLHMATLALIDIFVPRGAPSIVGVLSVLMLAAAGFSLFVFARRMVGGWLALAMACLFVVEFPGSLIVTYHHISPYLLSLAFLGFGAAAMADGTARISSVICLTLASLFHEMVPLGLAAALAYIALFHRTGIRHAAIIFGIPLGIFLLLNGIDAAIYGVSFQPGPADAGSHYLYSLSVPGGFLAALIAPGMVRLAAVPGYELPIWSNAANALPVLYVLSAVFALLTGSAAVLATRRLNARSDRGPVLCAVLAGGILLALVIGFGIGRAVARGPDYVAVATWYNAIAIYLMLMLAACMMRLYPSRAAHMSAAISVIALVVVNLAIR